jgi:asparagine synthase (glutamine-hydrolysing)
MSMSTSIESRVPFLDHRLVEFAARLPDRLKLRGFTTKYVLRRAMRGLVPDAILERRKMGFPVPFARWMRDEWNQLACEVLLDRRSRERGIVDAPAVFRLLRDHREGTCDGGNAIWALLNLEIWFRTFIDGCGVQTLPAPARSRSTTSYRTTDLNSHEPCPREPASEKPCTQPSSLPSHSFEE